MKAEGGTEGKEAARCGRVLKKGNELEQRIKTPMHKDSIRKPLIMYDVFFFPKTEFPCVVLTVLKHTLWTRLSLCRLREPPVSPSVCGN